MGADEGTGVVGEGDGTEVGSGEGLGVSHAHPEPDGQAALHWLYEASLTKH